MRRLSGYAWRYRTNVLLSFGASLVGMAISALVPLIPRHIIDDVITTHSSPLAPWAIALVAAAVLVFLLTLVRRYFGGRLAMDVQHDMRQDLFESLTRLDGVKQDGLDTGQVVGRATSDLQMIVGLLSMLPMMTGNVLMFLLSVVVMFFLSPLLTLIVLAMAPALWWFASLSRKRLFPATWSAQQESGRVAGVVDGAVSGVRVVKGFGQEEQELGRLESASRRLYAKRLRGIRLSARYSPAMQAIPALAQVAVLALGGWLAVRGQVTLGTFVAFSTYVAQMTGPVRMLTMLLTVGQQARASVERVLQLIDERPVIKERAAAIDLELDELEELEDLGPNGHPAVSFENVDFAYASSAEPVLRGLDLSLRAGETVALVGASGSGKSTVGMLVPRFYDATSGTVRVHGHDVRDLTLRSLRAAIGIVPEDSFLFSESVRTNIAYGRPDATDDEVVAAARAAQADGFIRELPDGYDTVVGEQGLTLSGGQRQRVALARAILADPHILLLDDATSAVDAQVEAEIHEALRTVMAGRTTLLVAHRRSTLQLADRIGVLEQGRLVDLGTHEELDARCPLYRSLLTDPDAMAGDIRKADPAAQILTDSLLAAELADAELIDGKLIDGKLIDGELVGARPSGALTAAEGTTAGVTPELWDRERFPEPDPDAPATANGPGAGAGHPGGPGGMHAAMGSMAATPELLAKVAALPPANESPAIPLEEARRPDPGFNVRRMLAPFKRPLLLALLLVALDAVASLTLPILIRHGIDDGVSKGAAGAVALVSLVALGVVLADWAVQTAETQVSGRTGERVLYGLRVKIFAHLQRLGLDYYERELGGRIMTRMTTDVDALTSFLQTGVVTAVVSLLTFFGIFVVLLVLDAGLALYVFAVLPVLIAATLVFRSKSSKIYQLGREKVSTVNADLQENVAGMRIVQAFLREEHNRSRFAERSDDYRRTRVRAQLYISLYFPFVQLLSSVAAALVLIVGANRVNAGTLTTGALVAYLLYIDLFFSPVQQLSQVFDGYQQAAVGLSRIRELLRTPTSTPQAARPEAVGRLGGDVHFDDVRFAYNALATTSDADAGTPTRKSEVITGVNLRIPAGQTVALVGETGAGKSTLVKLLARFYDVTGGAVRVDGRDVRELDLAGYRHRLGVVPQESYLFAGTVRDAIAYGRPEASDAEVEAAARAVGAHEMIARLDGGYLYRVSERGRNLSAGQRQLIALARAELVDPDLLLLDEATAALDLATEAAVNRAADRLARHGGKRRTTLVIAHRLSTAARADRVVVMDHGRVVEDGTHAELLAADGSYARLWRAFVGEEQRETVS